MSGPGAPPAPDLDGSSLQVAVVAARWHAHIADALIDGAGRALRQCRVEQPALLRVPGAFELPIVAKALARERYDAIVALGVVIRGGTPHFDFVARAATDGCGEVARQTGVPIGFGLLTCDTEEQALDRCGLPNSSEDKGREAALAAVETALVLRRLRATEQAATPGFFPR